MGDPGHWEPVGSVARGQRPCQPLRGQPLPDVHVAGGVIGIVVVDEVEVTDLSVDRESRQEQPQINQQIETRAGERGWLLRLHGRLGSGLGHRKIILSIREGRRPESALTCLCTCPARDFWARVVTGMKRPAIAECDGRPMSQEPLKKLLHRDPAMRVADASCLRSATCLRVAGRGRRRCR